MSSHVVKSKDNESRLPGFKIQTLLLPLTSLEIRDKLRSSGLHFLLSNGHDDNTYLLRFQIRSRIWYINFQQMLPLLWWWLRKKVAHFSPRGTVREWKDSHPMFMHCSIFISLNLLSTVFPISIWLYPLGNISVPKLRIPISKSFVLYLQNISQNSSFGISMATIPVQAAAIYSLASCNNHWMVVVLHSRLSVATRVFI